MDNVKILILKQGWVLVGRHSHSGDEHFLHDASVVRYWGSSKGLGEIAAGGPTSDTKLDHCPPARVHESALVFTMDCDGSKWDHRLAR